MSPTLLTFAGTLLFIAIPAIAVLVWQYKGWRRTEALLGEMEDQYTATDAALNASPYGYFAWMGA